MTLPAMFKYYNMGQLIDSYESKRETAVIFKAKYDENENCDDDDVDMKANLTVWKAKYELAEADLVLIQTAMENLDLKHKADLQQSIIEVSATSNTAKPAANPGHNSHVLQMGNYITANVDIFDPNGGHVITFLSQLRLAYSLYVENSRYGLLLEEDFIRCAKSRLCLIVLEQLNDEKASFANFEAFEKLMTEKFAGLSTSFQLLQTCMDLEIRKGEAISAFATRVSRDMNYVSKAITAKFSEAKNRQMTAADSFNMVAGLRVLDMVKQLYPDVHKQMAAVSLDKMYSVTEVASEASRLIQHYKGTADSEFSGYNKPGGNRMRRDEPSKDKSETPKPSWWKEVCPAGPECSAKLKCKLYHSIKQRKTWKKLAKEESSALATAGTFQLPEEHHMRSMGQPSTNFG